MEPQWPPDTPEKATPLQGDAPAPGAPAESVDAVASIAGVQASAAVGLDDADTTRRRGPNQSVWVGADAVPGPSLERVKDIISKRMVELNVKSLDVVALDCGVERSTFFEFWKGKSVAAQTLARIAIWAGCEPASIRVLSPKK